MSVQFIGLLAAAKEQTGGCPGRSENPEVTDGNGAWSHDHLRLLVLPADLTHALARGNNSTFSVFFAPRL